MSAKKKYFITATNTQRGKTFFTAILALWLKENNCRVMVMKPVETGVKKNDFSLTSLDKISSEKAFSTTLSDFDAIIGFSDIFVNEEQKKYAHPYRFSLACSPHLAAECDGEDYPCIDHIKNCAEKLLKNCDVLLVEGAGGLFVPLDRKKKKTMMDLIKELDFEVILVAQSGLGAINDACLSIRAMQHCAIKIAGFVLNDVEKTQGDDYIRRDNAEVIKNFTGVPYLGNLGHVEKKTRQKCLEILENMPELRDLFHFNEGLL